MRDPQRGDARKSRTCPRFNVKPGSRAASIARRIQGDPMLRAALVSLAVLTAAPALAQPAPKPPNSAMAPEFRLKGDVVSLPFVMVREFPFVEAEINGVKGKLMLDTGASHALSLNQNPLHLTEGSSMGGGMFGSGQKFEVFLRPKIDSVVLPGGLTYGPVTTVQSQDATQLEHITPDFIGWMGYYFWEGYALKLDYRAGRVTFYKGGPKAFLKGETVVAALPFEVRKLPNHPIMTARIDGVDFETVFDTGQYGNLFADAATREKLTKDGAVTKAKGEADLKGIRFTKALSVNIPRIEVHEEPFPPAAPMGLTSSSILSLGYGFLNQYKTVWDYPNHTLYLLKR
jgi:hypothetical protein